MTHIGGGGFRQHLFEHAAEIVRIGITEPHADLRYVKRGVPHEIDRFIHSKHH
jgi:hypothetical protein